ncbi:hypothetical protein ACJX0J_037897, partial [Zea mays]
SIDETLKLCGIRHKRAGRHMFMTACKTGFLKVHLKLFYINVVIKNKKMISSASGLSVVFRNAQPKKQLELTAEAAVVVAAGAVGGILEIVVDWLDQKINLVITNTKQNQFHWRTYLFKFHRYRYHVFLLFAQVGSWIIEIVIKVIGI